MVTWTIAVAQWHSRHPKPSRRHWWRDLVTEAWRSALEAWEREAEQVAIGYATELAEFTAANPKPQLRHFMEHLATGRTAPERLGTWTAPTASDCTSHGNPLEPVA